MLFESHLRNGAAQMAFPMWRRGCRMPTTARCMPYVSIFPQPHP